MHDGCNDVAIFKFFVFVEAENNEVLDFEITDNVVGLVAVDGDFREVSFFQYFKHFVVNDRLFIQDNSILKLDHIILDDFGP